MDGTGRAGRGGSAGRALLAWIAILGLAALVGWLLVERNARTWWLVPEDGLLVVKRGIPFPVGRQAFATSDPALAEAYAPLVPPPGAKLGDEQRFDDRSGLDQALFEVLAGWARDDVASGEPARLERGLGYLSRAEKLAGVSAAQRDALRALRGESAFYEGARLLARGAEALRLAAEKLRLASGAATPLGGDAAAVLRDVEPVADAALAASRAASRLAPHPPPPAAERQGDAPAPSR